MKYKSLPSLTSTYVIFPPPRRSVPPCYTISHTYLVTISSLSLSLSLSSTHQPTHLVNPVLSQQDCHHPLAAPNTRSQFVTNAHMLSNAPETRRLGLSPSLSLTQKAFSPIHKPTQTQHKAAIGPSSKLCFCVRILLLLLESMNNLNLFLSLSLSFSRLKCFKVLRNETSFSTFNQRNHS